MAQDNLQSQSEQEIQFKKRARRRLVGAIALVLLMIVLLPMLLEDKLAQVPKEDVVISIPSQDSQLETKPEAQPVKQAEPTPVPAPEVQASVDLVKPEETPSPVVEKQPAPVVQQEVPAPKKEEAKPKPVEPVIKAEEKPKTDPASAHISIQIGVFSDPENVKKLQAQLADKGLKSYSEVIDTEKGKKTRLRVGPYPSKKEAESALAKVKALGLTGMIVGN